MHYAFYLLLSFFAKKTTKRHALQKKNEKCLKILPNLQKFYSNVYGQGITIKAADMQYVFAN